MNDMLTEIDVAESRSADYSVYPWQLARLATWARCAVLITGDRYDLHACKMPYGLTSWYVLRNGRHAASGVADTIDQARARAESAAEAWATGHTGWLVYDSNRAA